MKRRDFLAGCAMSAFARAEATDRIVTVTGTVAPNETGMMLPHEHVMSIFDGDAAYHVEYDEEKLFAVVVPYLQYLRKLGCGTVADCTAAWFGRSPDVLKRVSEKTGITILTNTGYYGAARGRYLPKQAHTDSARALADHWTAEWKEGIDGTGIRPGFLKIGVSTGDLSEVDVKLVRAAALTHAETGMVMAVHTGAYPQSVQRQLEILKSEGVAPEAWIWVHADKVENPDDLLPAADAGAWIELDAITESSIGRQLEMVNVLKRHGHLERTLLSHDGNYFRHAGRPPHPFHALFTHFIPALRQAGYSEAEIRQLVTLNPARAFTIRKCMV